MSIPKINTNSKEAYGSWVIGEPVFKDNTDSTELAVSLPKGTFEILDNKYFKELFLGGKIDLVWNFSCDYTFKKKSGRRYNTGKFSTVDIRDTVKFSYGICAVKDFVMDIKNHPKCFDPFFDNNVQIKKGMFLSDWREVTRSVSHRDFGEDPSSFIRIQLDTNQDESIRLEPTDRDVSRVSIFVKDEPIYKIIRSAINDGKSKQIAKYLVIAPAIPLIYIQWKEAYDSGNEVAWHLNYAKALGYPGADEMYDDLSPEDILPKFAENFEPGTNIFRDSITAIGEELFGNSEID